MVRKEALCQWAAPTNHQCELDIMEANQQLQQPSQHLDHDLMRPQTRSTQLICSWNSWPIESV